MKSEIIENHDTNTEEKTTGLVAIIQSVPRVLVPLFALFFLSFALLYASSAIIEFIKPILSDGDLTGGLVKGVHMGVVALAVYELAQVVHQEYDKSGKAVRRDPAHPPQRDALRQHRVRGAGARIADHGDQVQPAGPGRFPLLPGGHYCQRVAVAHVARGFHQTERFGHDGRRLAQPRRTT